MVVAYDGCGPGHHDRRTDEQRHAAPDVEKSPVKGNDASLVQGDGCCVEQLRREKKLGEVLDRWQRDLNMGMLAQVWPHTCNPLCQ